MLVNVLIAFKHIITLLLFSLKKCINIYKNHILELYFILRTLI